MPRTLLALAATLLVGCGATETEPETEPETARPPAQMAAAERPEEPRPAPRKRERGTRVKVVDSQFGRILADGRGQAVYYFDLERTRRSECHGDCARAWPPVLTNGRPVAGRGARAGLIGTTRRRGGGARQVTYDGHPLYYYVDDAPGRVLCHNVLEFGGLWLVVRPDGAPVA